MQIQNQKQNNETCQCECKSYLTCKKDYSWNLSTCICENGKYLKSVLDDSKILCNGIISATDIVSTNVTNTVPTNVTKTIPTNVTSTLLTASDDKKVKYKMDCYILHTALLVITLLFIIVIIYYNYAKH